MLSGRLFEWRERIERTLIPKQALPESECSRIASRFAPIVPLGQAIQTAIRDLEGIAASHRAARREVVKTIEAAVPDAAVAEADLGV